MKKKKAVKMTAKSLWQSPPTAKTNLDLILGSLKSLPLTYWRKNFFFKGARDEELIHITKGSFPGKLIPNKTHPVFSLQKLPQNTGFRVCPCSTIKYFRQKKTGRYVKKGCVLKHTGQVMDRDSRLVENICFNMPASIAGKLRFIGEVPETCLVQPDRESLHD